MLSCQGLGAVETKLDPKHGVQVSHLMQDIIYLKIMYIEERLIHEPLAVLQAERELGVRVWSPRNIASRKVMVGDEAISHRKEPLSVFEDVGTRS